MCERLEAVREVRRCAEALTLACVVSAGLGELYGHVLAEPIPPEIEASLAELDMTLPEPRP